MEGRFYQASYGTPNNKSLAADSFFDPTSPSDSSTSSKRFERKPDPNRRRKSREKRDSNNTIFAGFYSPKQFTRYVWINSEICKHLR